MIEKLELQWLLSFQAVYENLSFKLAAEQRQIPTSNISRHVALLEHSLNTRLLERTTRKMVATEAGQKLYQSISPLITAMDNVLDEVTKDNTNVSGHLKIIAPDLPFLADIFANFCHQHPRIQLSCDTQLNPQESVLDGYDLILCFSRGNLPDSNWVAKEMLRWKSSIVAAPSLLEKYALPNSIEDLIDTPCITSLSIMQGKPWRFKNDQIASIQSNYKVNSGQMAKVAALKGLGFAILPRQSCEAEIESGKLVEIQLNQEPADLVLYAMYSSRPFPKQKVKSMLDMLSAVCEDIA